MTSQSTDDLQNIHLYESLLSQHGDSFKSLNWGSRESQIKRFEVLAEVGIKSGDSVLDVGCGLADFYAWLQDNQAGVFYSGIDITPGMIKQAKKKYPDIALAVTSLFELSLGRDSYNYIVASGIFTYMGSNSNLAMQKLVQRMFDLSSVAVAFNSLSSWSSDKESDEFYADPYETMEFCRSLTPWVTLRHDYHPRDFTIYMYKESNS